MIIFTRVYFFLLSNGVVTSTLLQYFFFIPTILTVTIAVKTLFIIVILCLKLSLFLYFLLFNIWVYLIDCWIIIGISNSYPPSLWVISRERSALNLILSLDLTPYIWLLLVNRWSYNTLNIDINFWVCKLWWWSVNLFKFHQSIPSYYLTRITQQFYLTNRRWIRISYK